MIWTLLVTDVTTMVATFLARRAQIICCTYIAPRPPQEAVAGCALSTATRGAAAEHWASLLWSMREAFGDVLRSCGRWETSRAVESLDAISQVVLSCS